MVGQDRSNSLMVEIDMVNKKKFKQSAKMTYVALEKEPLTINLGEYDFSFQKAMQKQLVFKGNSREIFLLMNKSIDIATLSIIVL